MTTRHVLEIAFRHLRRLFVLGIIPALIGFGVAYELPRSFQCTAGLKSLEHYAVINASGVSEANMQETPAQTQADALNDDLTSPSFDVAVAAGTGLPEQMRASVGSNDPAIRDAIFQDLSTHVLVAATGVNHYTITYTNRDRTVALKVVQGIIAQWTAQAPSFAVVAGQKLLADEQVQLAAYQHTLDAALSAEKAYANAHPGSTAANDPNYVVLANNTMQAQNAVTNEQTAITKLQATIDQLGTSANLFQVSDAPQLPYRPVSRIKLLAEGGGGGLAVGLVACALYLVLLLRRDRSVYSAQDLSLSGVPVIAEMRSLSSAATKASVRLLEPAGARLTGSDGTRKQRPAQR